MSITREQVADLQPGDVVEVTYDEHPDAFTRGPLRRATDGRLWLGGVAVVEKNGEPTWNGYLRLLTVISRAPRRLYVNHDRTEPVPGDVVRDAGDDASVITYDRCVDAAGIHAWRTTGGVTWLTGTRKHDLPTRLRLLVDGATGMPVAVKE